MKAKHVTTTVIVLCFCVSLFMTTSSAQDIEGLQRGVVRIEATGFGGERKIGTGFIIELTRKIAYIVTASHDVEGDKQPKIEFFTQRNIPVVASVIGLEGDDPRGLALLLVRGEENLPSGLLALPLSSSVRLRSSDGITVIGFPRLAGPWSVIKGNIVSRRGRDIFFDGAIDEGNSGGPVIKDGQIAGLVTGLSGAYGCAIPVTSVQLFLEGWGIETTQQPEPSPIPTPLPTATPIPLPTETPTRIRLRSGPRTVSADEAQTVFGLDENWWPLEYIKNEFEDRGDVVVDHVTGLMWQKSGSEKMIYDQAQAYIEKLNRERFGGYDDWRLPTVPELMSLLEPEKQSNSLYINPIFDEQQQWCWSQQFPL